MGYEGAISRGSAAFYQKNPKAAFGGGALQCEHTQLPKAPSVIPPPSPPRSRYFAEGM
jgi:hypothetical protein